jgi:hypothetical protein
VGAFLGMMHVFRNSCFVLFRAPHSPPLGSGLGGLLGWFMLGFYVSEMERETIESEILSLEVKDVHFTM